MTVVNWSVVAALVAGLACHSDPLSPRDPQLMVNETTLAIWRDGQYLRGEIPFTYTNRSGRTLALHGCRPPGSPDLEWWNGREWRLAYHRVEMMCLSPPFLVAPGTTLSYTLSLFLRDVAQVQVDWLGPRQRAEYRLVWGLRDAASGAAVRLDQRISNTFTLDFPEP